MTTPRLVPAALVLLLPLAWLGLVPSGATADCLPSADLDSKVDTIKSALTSAGFGYVDAQFTFYNMDLCKTQSCFFQNPLSPYGLLQVPNNPTGTNPTLKNFITNSSWTMSDSEAILVVGCLPPESRYIGFTPYVFYKFMGATHTPPYFPVFSSMADAINGATIQSFSETNDSFDIDTALLMTGSENAYADISDVVAAAFNSTADKVNLLTLPAGDTTLNLQFGNAPGKDTFTMLFRQAVALNQTAYDLWSDSNPFRVLRIFYNTPPSPNNLNPSPTFKPRLNGSAYEDQYASAYASLVNDTITRLGGRYSVTQRHTTLNGFGYQIANTGATCYKLGVQCAGDTRDASYMATQRIQSFNFTGDEYIFIGANHNEIGDATYSNIVMYRLANQLGVVQELDTQYLNSANAPVPNFASPSTPNGFVAPQPQFFLWKFARSCGPLDQRCTTVPGTGFPAIENGADSIFIDRIYLSSATYAAPLPTSVIQPIMLGLEDLCRPQACDSPGNCAGPGYALYNIAFGSYSVSQSSTLFDFNAVNAVDGHTGFLLPVAITLLEYQPYWQIDLGFARKVSSVTITGIWGQLWILASTSPIVAPDLATAQTQATYSTSTNAFETVTITFDGSGQMMQYLRLQMPSFGILVVAEVDVEAYCLTSSQ